MGMSAALIQAGQTAPARADVAAASSAQTIADVAKRAGKRIDLTQLAATVAAQKAGSAAPAAAAAAAADAECAVAGPSRGQKQLRKATAPTAARCKRKLQQGRSSFATLQGPARGRGRSRRCGRGLLFGGGVDHAAVETCQNPRAAPVNGGRGLEANKEWATPSGTRGWGARRGEGCNNGRKERA